VGNPVTERHRRGLLGIRVTVGFNAQAVTALADLPPTCHSRALIGGLKVAQHPEGVRKILGRNEKYFRETAVPPENPIRDDVQLDVW
jgi:hypothetical protein